MTSATLTIDHFRTTLTLSDGQPGPGVRLNVLGEGDWETDFVSYFRAAADRLITTHGYVRADEWSYNASRDMHTAAIKPAN
ncbi:hypothetical protein [Micromonospora sp. NPDC050695]|uniref:hypothetical protein n=1 Tax=Micromonospora sp. NPDC050695 TaxID=3154938 RepID=UPI0033DADA19